MPHHLITDEARVRFMTLYEQGKKDNEIADEIGVHRRTVLRWRQEMGLPAKNGRGPGKTYHTPEERKQGEREYYESTRAYLLAAQRCLDCHKQDAYTLNGRHYCAECVEKNREYLGRWRERNREKVNEQARERTAKRRAAGLCIQCGTPSNGKCRCPRCAARKNRKNVEARIRAGMNYPRGDNGLCWQCNKNPALENYALCEACMENLRENVWPARRGTGTSGPPLIFGRLLYGKRRERGQEHDAGTAR